MRLEPLPPGRLGIALSTTLWSWSISLLTLGVFAGVLIPHLKESVRENLDCRAQGVAVSLRDELPGALANEDLYHQVMVVGAGCLMLSLAASALYARRLVRPILGLHDMVQRAARGDLTARVAVGRRDELGVLAGAVNAMTAALWRRDRILESVRHAAQQFLVAPDWQAVMDDVLAKVGEAAEASRAYVFENRRTEQGGWLGFQRYEWAAPGITPQIHNPALQGFDYDASGFGRWVEVLAQGEILNASVAGMPASERPVLEAQAIRSLMVIPIRVEGEWWGFLGLDECQGERVWNQAEADSLRAAADMFGATIARQRTRDALLEARDTLEERVLERTQALEQEVRAKETALAERAQAEARLSESEQRFRSLYENATLGIYRTAADGRLLLANPALRKMMGFPSAGATPTLNGAAAWYVHPEERARYQSLMTSERQVLGLESHWRRYDGTVIRVRESARAIPGPGGEIQWYEGTVEDITVTKAAEEELVRLNRELQEVARQAGMAEVAASVLHNVGNVLNSVSVSATIVGDRLRESKVVSLHRAATMLQERNGDLAEFLASDPKGQVLPRYLVTLADQLATEQRELLQEVKQLEDNIEHIKKVVAMQQNYARVSGAFEEVPPTELLEDALRMTSTSLQSRHIQLTRDYERDLPRVTVDRHRVLQILINLLRNACHALGESRGREKRLGVKVRRASGDAVAIAVEDNGVGIAPGNLTCIFQHGFTTKKDGHGFGLHSGANAARAMGGRLTATSPGVDRGAVFTLELPVHRPPENLS